MAAQKNVSAVMQLMFEIIRLRFSSVIAVFRSSLSEAIT
jgi:hypothetical protein